MLRRLVCVPLLLAVVTLGGCATFTNPVDSVDMYRVKSVYAATLQAAVSYRRYCYARPYRDLMKDPVARPVCANRRAVILAAQKHEPKANGAIVAADNFVRNNPTISAATAVGAAWRAVSDFRAAVPAVPGS